jgi:potassium-dependent mechanosensitive channel
MLNNLFRQQRKILSLFFLAIATFVIAIALPVYGQNPLGINTDKAPVVLDGKVLFEVGNTGNFTAFERAEIINNALKQEVKSSDPVKLQVIASEQQSIIRTANNTHLLTVTQSDVIPGTSPGLQAQTWKNKIEQAIRKGQLERTPEYRNQALLFSITVLLITIFIQVISLFISRFILNKLVRLLANSKTSLHAWEEQVKLFIKLGIFGLQAGLWLSVYFYIIDLFPDLRNFNYSLIKAITLPIITVGESSYSALGLIFLIALSVGLWFGVSNLTDFFKSYILVKTGADTGAQNVIAILTRYILTFLGLIILLQLWGIDVRSLAIFASVLGVGIGFGVQNIINNFISGLIITLERPIQVGDFVNLGNLMGIVKKIGARSTEITTLDQVTILVPNSRFLENEVINWSHSDPVSRLKIPVGVAYGSNLEMVKNALLKAAKSHPEVLLRPSPEVWFREFGESALNFDLLVWIGDPRKQFKVKSDLNYRIEASLRRYHIEIPFPQRDLHLRSPYLEQFIKSWLQQNAPQMLENQPLETSIPETENIVTENFAQQFTEEEEKSELSQLDLEVLVAKMRGKGGLEIKDRRYRLNIYHKCFIGLEAVDWLVQKYNCLRNEAVEIGQKLIDRGIIRHVSDDNIFKDEYTFYRFYSDE